MELKINARNIAIIIMSVFFINIRFKNQTYSKSTE